MMYFIPMVCVFISSFLRGIQHEMLSVKTIKGASTLSFSICLFDGSVIYFIANASSISVVFANAIGAAVGMGSAVYIVKRIKNARKQIK